MYSVRRLYFDHNATTPVAPEVVQTMASCLAEVYGNASSIHHFGQRAKQLLEEARLRLAAALGCASQEVVFTSGGTEAGNLAVLGRLRQERTPRRHAITTAIEHPAVLAACAQLQREGVEITYLPVGPGGVVDPDDVRRAIRGETALISVMHANNELGTVQPVSEIVRIAREAGVCLHSDGVQALGKIPVDTDANLYSVSAHKIYAPKGVGALRVRKGTALAPASFGGRHERGRRAGTENVPGAMAFARAVELLEVEREAARVGALRDRFEAAVLDRVPAAGVNGASSPRVPNTSNIYFDGIDGEALVIALDLRGFAVSTGAACSSGAVEPSHVLTAIGLPPERARASIRFSFGRYNTADEVDALVGAVAAGVDHLRKISPVAYAHA
jgi:cysteine desulfurase